MHTDKYSDFPLGLYIVRGDGIVLLGELDADESRMSLQKMDPEELLRVRAEEEQADAAYTKWDFAED